MKKGTEAFQESRVYEDSKEMRYICGVSMSLKLPISSLNSSRYCDFDHT